MKTKSSKFKKTSIKVILATLLVIFSAATIYATASNSYRVSINVGDDVKTVTTFKTKAEDILKQAGIELGEDDVLDLDGFSSGTNSKINIYRSADIKVFDDDASGVQLKIAGKVEDALKALSIEVSDADKINFQKDDILTDGMEIRITRAFPVKITVDGKDVTVTLAGGTVSDALDKAVIAIDDDDIISSPLNAQLKKGMTIKVSHVEIKERTEKIAINFTTKTINDNTLYKGQAKIKQAGVKGEKTVTYKEKYVDGQLKESKEVKSEITKQAVEEIKIVGTKANETAALTGSSIGTSAGTVRTISNLKAPSGLKLNGNVPTSYKQKIVGTASGYSSDAITATGKACQPGYIAVNPSQIPYGTKMWIVSDDGAYVYGYASAEDTGGFIYWTGNRATVADLFFDTEAQAEAFGRRSVTIYIL